MSIDTHMLLRTPFSAEQVKAALVHDPALTGLGLVDHGGPHGLYGDKVGLIVAPWEEDDHDLIEDGLRTATVTVTLIPGRREAGWEAFYRVLAAILRLVPGDVCAADQNAGGLDLLRLGEVVYVDPDGFQPENLTDFGYHLKRIVVGIPDSTVEAAQ